MIVSSLYDFNKMNKNRLAEAAKLAQEGHITRSLEILQQDAQNGLTHALASNMAALYLQLGNKVEALDYATKAIALDPYSYIGYFNRFLCYFNEDKAIAKL
jgi:tetratricopeptide (TPR) repeat protein